ncbi:MAG TPA: hypothetical protein VMV55_01450 [Methanoregula sp.]|nr:hypothetical protein [Methanoregula sp.]
MTEGLKTVEGQIASINSEKRLLAIENRDGIIFYSVSWLPTQDQKIGKLKVGYYVKPTVEVKGDSSGRLIDLPYCERPADWPKSNKGTGNWQPKRPRVTIAATVNLTNYENIKVEVKGNSPEECMKIMVDTLNGFATNPLYSTTRDMVQSYMRRVLNQGGS